MRNQAIFVMSVAFAWYAAFGSARPANAQTSNNRDAAEAESAASQMVPAQARLSEQLDTKTLRPGEQFKATLSDKVMLKNGIELPKGTDLVGTVEKKTAPEGARSVLALRFTQADLKSGKTVPIEATIVNVAPQYDNLSVISTEAAPPLPWDGKAVQIDVEGVISGVDLHSRIAGADSGVFESARKSDIKLTAGTQMALAIGAEGANAGNGAL